MRLQARSGGESWTGMTRSSNACLGAVSARPASGIFHVSMLQDPSVCPTCGAALMHRPDDQAETVFTACRFITIRPNR